MADKDISIEPESSTILSWPLPSLPTPLSWKWAVIYVMILLSPIFTHVLSTLRFRNSCRINSYHDTLASIPAVPYWNILLGHLFDLAWDTNNFVDKTVKLAAQGPVQVKAGVIDFIVVSSPRQIQKVFLSCKKLSSKQLAVLALQNLFGASKDIAKLFEDDEISTASAVGKFDSTSPHDDARLEDHVSGFNAQARTYLSGQHVKSISENSLLILERNTKSLNIREEWIEFPDLYDFLQCLISGATVEALMGSKIFEINPNIIQDFWTFERGTPKFLRFVPRWLMSINYRARDRVFNTLKQLDELASQHLPRLQPSDPDWEPYLGSKFLRARFEHGTYIESLRGDTKAWEKMGIMFGSNANLLPSTFWYIFEALNDDDLRHRMIGEVMSCVAPKKPNVARCIDRILQQPLLQSAYAETLRMRVTIALPRTCEYEEFDFFGHKIKKNEHLLIFTSPVVQDDKAWTRAGKPPLKPFEEFWAERFLAPKHSSKQKIGTEEPEDLEFSLRGLAGRWMPYGGGQHLCPGRHYAKSQIIGSFAFLFANYELELLNYTAKGSVQPDMRRFPMGSLPPDRKVPFKIRRKPSNLFGG